MKDFDPEIAASRFGTGQRLPIENDGASQSTILRPANSIDEILQQLSAAPLDRFSSATPSSRVTLARRFRLRTRIIKAKNARNRDRTEQLTRQLSYTEQRRYQLDAHGAIARAVLSPNGFVERLVAHWTSHFTVSRRTSGVLALAGSFQNVNAGSKPFHSPE